MSPNTPNADHSIIQASIRSLPSIFAQVAYLAQLRDPNTGLYRHRLYQGQSRAEGHQVLEALHEDAFKKWLRLHATAQKSDLERYLDSLECERSIAIRNWTNLEPYRSYVPAPASAVDREWFFSGMATLLRMLAVRDTSPDRPTQSGLRERADHEGSGGFGVATCPSPNGSLLG